jgi:hypothetical protein
MKTSNGNGAGKTGVIPFNFDTKVFKENFDREPFGLTHNLSGLDLFSDDSLRALANKYEEKRDYYVAGGAPKPGAKFYSVVKIDDKPGVAYDKLDSGAFRILLKRPEDKDPRFKKLLDDMFSQVIDLKGGLGDDKVERIEAAVFISSAATTTPFHFDPEIAFFCQIAGEKIYHVYSPSAVSESELEDFYNRGVVDIAQVDLEGRDKTREHVFNLVAGKGLHQPQNAPHWVETGAGRSISFSFVFETTATRAVSKARGFNHYLRKMGMKPKAIGARAGSDKVKAKAMSMVVPARRAMGSVVRKVVKK